MKLMLIFYAILLFTVGTLGETTEKEPLTEITFGSVALDIPVEMVKRLTPMIDYLNKKTGYSITLQVSANMTSAIDSVGRNRTQIAYLTPAAYIEAHKKYGILPLVSFLQNGKNNCKLVIVVKKDSSIKTIADLKGKKFAFGDKMAKLQPATVHSSGLKLEDFYSYDYLYHYDHVAKAVINGEFDAGILAENLASKYKKQGLKVIYTSVTLPAHIIAINSKLAPEIALNLKNALLALNKKNPESTAIFTAFEPTYDGFKVAKDKDYDAARALLKTLN